MHVLFWIEGMVSVTRAGEPLRLRAGVVRLQAVSSGYGLKVEEVVVVEGKVVWWLSVFRKSDWMFVSGMQGRDCD